jgi:intracellular septation protein
MTQPHKPHQPHVTTQDSPDTDAPTLPPRLKLAVDLGPLLIFFGTFVIGKRTLGDHQGVIWATGAFVIATVAAIAISYAAVRRVQVMTLVTGVIVLVMGGLTIYLKDERFIKLKPTVVSGSMGTVLLVGLAMGRPLIKLLLGSSIELDDVGWRKLTLRWGLFFLFIAGLNEVVWRHTSTSTWMNFKIFGILGLTFIFLLFQGPLFERHRIESTATGAPSQNPESDEPESTPPPSA